MPYNNIRSTERRDNMLDFFIYGIFWVLALYGLFEVIKNIIYICTYTKLKSDGIYMIIAVKNQEDKIEGFVKILADDNEIKGAHIISEEASAMIEQIAIAMTNKIPPKGIINTIFAHPAYSEGILESMLALDNLAIHIPQKKD